MSLVLSWDFGNGPVGGRPVAGSPGREEGGASEESTRGESMGIGGCTGCNRYGLKSSSVDTVHIRDYAVRGAQIAGGAVGLSVAK